MVVAQRLAYQAAPFHPAELLVRPKQQAIRALEVEVQWPPLEQRVKTQFQQPVPSALALEPQQETGDRERVPSGCLQERPVQHTRSVDVERRTREVAVLD